MRNYKLTTFYKSLKPLILLLIDTLFHKILVFLLMVYRETDFCPKIENRQNH